MLRFQQVSLIVDKLWPRRKTLLIFWGMILLISAQLSGCVESSPRLDRLFSLRIHTTDLPSGWYREKGGIGDRDKESSGIISRWVQFRGVPEKELPSVLVIQELVDYPTQDQAANAYTEITKEMFPVEEWVWPEQVQLKSEADQFRLACLERQVDIYGEVDERFQGSYLCTSVGQYETVISIIHANVFRDQWLTFEDLEDLLEVAEARLISQP